jgi:23S rRNA (uridine2552-2'-O)-methyltransferase
VAYNPKDYYFHKAKTENYVARSVFKLQEMDQKFHLFKPGYHVLDLGAAPGSWSQYASGRIGTAGRVLGIDLQAIALSLPNAVFIRADLNDLPWTSIFESSRMRFPVDVVLSDMAPKTTGIRVTDQARSIQLCQLALEIAIKSLKAQGSFVCKLFHGEDFTTFRTTLQSHFRKVEILRPKSTRKESKEVFFIAIQYKGNPII